MLERTIDFAHGRTIRCLTCRGNSAVTEAWMVKFFDGTAGCPKCAKQFAESQDLIFVSNENEEMQQAESVKTMYWYHTSILKDWLNGEYSPEATLTEPGRRHYELYYNGGVEGWSSQQKSQALHVGTYEAAIENMFRHVRERGAAHNKFYLYRVVLRRDCKILDSVHPEPPSSWGSAKAGAILNDDLDVYRYENNHEDRSSISLALNRHAIAKVQMVPIPIRSIENFECFDERVKRLEKAERTKIDSQQTPQTLQERVSKKLTGHQVEDTIVKSSVNRLSEELKKVKIELAEGLPQSIASDFRCLPVTAQTREEIRPAIEELSGFRALLVDPSSVLRELDKQPWRQVSPTTYNSRRLAR